MTRVVDKERHEARGRVNCVIQRTHCERKEGRSRTRKLSLNCAARLLERDSRVRFAHESQDGQRSTQDSRIKKVKPAARKLRHKAWIAIKHDGLRPVKAEGDVQEDCRALIGAVVNRNRRKIHHLVEAIDEH